MNALDAVEAALATRPVPGTPRPFTFRWRPGPASRAVSPWWTSICPDGRSSRPASSCPTARSTNRLARAGNGARARALTEGTAHAMRSH